MIKLPTPTKAQKEWQDCELGVVFHFDMPVYHEDGWEWDNAYKKTLDPSLYQPNKLDTDQWLKSAADMGAKYAVFTATHMGGFLQWQSDLYPYGVKQSPWRNGKGDVLDDFVKSCKKYNIRPGVFMSLRFNAYFKLKDMKVDFGKSNNIQKQNEYLKVAEKMVDEVTSRYGDLLEIWFDGGVKRVEDGGIDALSIVEKNQSNIVFYSSPKKRADHRWIGNEEGVAAYPCWATVNTVDSPNTANCGIEMLEHGDPDGQYWMPAMCDPPLRGANSKHEWFWRPNDEDAIFQVKDLTDMYLKSVGRNCNMIVGISPNRDGLVSEPDANRMKEFGNAIRNIYKNKIGNTCGSGYKFDISFSSSQLINQIVIMEDIEFGERIREYEVTGEDANGNTYNLCSGQSIGHKRIQQFDEKRLIKITLTCNQSLDLPIIKDFSVYNVEK